MSPSPLTSHQRRHLRALAHPLEPVVQIGHQGTTAPLIAQVDQALSDHELVKIRLNRECPLSPAEAGLALAEPTGAEVVQVIGRTLVVYRADPNRPRIELPGRPAATTLKPPGRSPRPNRSQAAKRASARPGGRAGGGRAGGGRAGGGRPGTAKGRAAPPRRRS